MNDFDSQWKFSQKWMPDVIAILHANSMKFISITNSSQDEDLNKATDLNITIVGGQLGVRVRKSSILKRDFTLRAINTGHVTELEKLRNKNDVATWYIYGWETNNKLDDWIMVNIQAMKKSGLLYDNRKPIPNPDGKTWFNAYTIAELHKSNAIAEFKATSELMISEIKKAGIQPMSRPRFTITLTFRPNTFSWLLRAAHAMLTKERGHDGLTFIIQGEAISYPPIHYTPLLLNDLTKLVENYATIKVESLT
jgi:hypothetical protein